MLLLTKGGGLNLTKGNGGPSKIAFALGWSPAIGKVSFDLDASAICLRGNSLVDEDDVLYYNSNKYEDPITKKIKWVDRDFMQPYILNKALIHSGDELEGGRDGDDEVITIDLASLPASVTEIAFCVTINEAKQKRQSFGQVSNAFIRVDDVDASQTLGQYNLNRDAGSYSAVVIGYITKDIDSWDFIALGQGLDGDLNEVMKQVPKIIKIDKQKR